MTSKHLDQIAALGCIVCGHAAVIHHACGGSLTDRGINRTGYRRPSDWLAIPLCPNHHNGPEGIHTLGVRTWEARYGAQAAALDRLCKLTGRDLWALAETHPERKRKASTKIVQRRGV